MSRGISKRADRTWKRLGSWYGTKLTEQYGKNPPDDWCVLIDRTDDERLENALIDARHASPAFPPTLGQIEAAIPRKSSSGADAPSIPSQLAFAILAKYQDLCAHQCFSRWTYFGPMTEFISKHRDNEVITHPRVRGVHINPCNACGKPFRRMTVDELVSEGIGMLPAPPPTRRLANLGSSMPILDGPK